MDDIEVDGSNNGQTEIMFRWFDVVMGNHVFVGQLNLYVGGWIWWWRYLILCIDNHFQSCDDWISIGRGGLGMDWQKSHVAEFGDPVSLFGCVAAKFVLEWVDWAIGILRWWVGKGGRERKDLVRREWRWGKEDKEGGRRRGVEEGRGSSVGWMGEEGGGGVED